MSRHVRKILYSLLAFTLVCGISLVAGQLWDYHSAQLAEQQARQQVARIPDDPVPLPPLPEPEPELERELLPDEHMLRLAREIDLTALQQSNPDVLGWITIPGTQLDYPFLQGEDNQYYLNHTWLGKRNAAGSVFLESQMAPDFSGFNTIVYAHNMKNGSMFGSLRSYRTQSHYENNPCIYIVNVDGVSRYEIFAAFEAEVTGWTYRLDVNTPEKKQTLLDYSAAHSILKTELTPTVEDSIITLSTCTGNGYDYRWVVQAVLTGSLTAAEPSAPAAGH